jgi:hypothetical protein
MLLLRCYPEVIPPTVARRASNRLGKNRILTYTPDTEKIEEHFMSKREKENCLVPKSHVTTRTKMMCQIQKSCKTISFTRINLVLQQVLNVGV